MAYNNSVPVVDVCGKRTMDYLIQVLAKINRGAVQVMIRGIGGNISQAASVAQILADRFDCRIMSANVASAELNQTKAPRLEMTVLFEPKTLQPKIADYQLRQGFISFPVYHLLFDMLLHSHGSLVISVHGDKPLVSIKKAGWNFRCKLLTNSDSFWNPVNGVANACYRSGLLLSPYWKKVSNVLSQHDDVILGLDTNILSDVVLSEQILTSLFMIHPRGYVHTPNWILVVIPNAVIHELEQAANSRDDHGYLQEDGRRGFRALQEILELNSSADLSGISLIVVGDADPALDTRVELRALREDLAEQARRASEVGKKESCSTVELSTEKQEQQNKPLMSRKKSSGDLIIRAQFRKFLRQIDFHKGIFFITGDKSNAALARAEGVQSIYYRNRRQEELEHDVEPPSVPCNDPSGPVVLGVPIGRLIYELAVEYGRVQIGWKNGDKAVLACDRIGESLDHWTRKELIVSKDSLQKLLALYTESGRLPLRQISEVYEEVQEQLMGSEAL